MFIDMNDVCNVYSEHRYNHNVCANIKLIKCSFSINIIAHILISTHQPSRKVHLLFLRFHIIRFFPLVVFTFMEQGHMRAQVLYNASKTTRTVSTKAQQTKKKKRRRSTNTKTICIGWRHTKFAHK